MCPNLAAAAFLFVVCELTTIMNMSGRTEHDDRLGRREDLFVLRIEIPTMFWALGKKRGLSRVDRTSRVGWFGFEVVEQTCP